MFDISTPIWVKGTVVRYEPISPHAMLELDASSEDGQLQRWTVEGPFPGRLKRILGFNGVGVDDDFLKVGALVEVCGFALKTEFAARRLYAAPERSPNRFVHGHMLVMPDGRMQSWGPYGQIDNCVRPNDEPQAWAGFLNTDPLARDFWCNSRASARVAPITTRAFAEEINRLMASPCE
jgi:hypothetical protein